MSECLVRGAALQANLQAGTHAAVARTAKKGGERGMLGFRS